MTHFAFEPIFASWPLLLALTVLLIGLPLTVRVHGGELDVRRRRTLTILRVIAAGLLLLAVLRPTVLSTDSEPSRATLAVLLDRSRSMTLGDDDSRSRWATQLALWKSLAPSLSGLDDSLDLTVLGYADEATQWYPSDLDALSEDVPPDGSATDLAAALAAALRTAAGQPLAGVVLMGDGVHNPPRRAAGDGATSGTAAVPGTATGRATGGGAQTGDPQNVARSLAALDVPLWTVPIGPPGDAAQVRDVEIAELPETFNVFAGNQFAVEFVVRAQALDGIELPIRLWLTDESDPQGRREVASRRQTPSRTSDAIAMSIPLTIDQPGSYQLEVEVEPQAGETLLSNNSRFSFLDVREGGGRILYLEGQPRPEQRFIRLALRRFPDLELTYRWISEATASSWPLDLGDVFDPGRFDIYIIGDLPAEAIGDRQWERLAAAVEAGSGLITLGGLSAYDDGGYGRSPLADVLPVQLGRRPDGANSQLEGDIAPRLTVPHPITTLGVNDSAAGAQQAAWDELPPLVGANRLGPPRVAPGVSVLLETAESEPLLVIGEYGSGRVVSSALDSTWRWWRRGDDSAHRRFWRQLMLWAIGRDDDDAEIRIELDRRRFVSGDVVGWQVTGPTAAVGDDQAPEIIGSDGNLVEVIADITETDPTTGQTSQSGTLPTLAAGLYRLRVRQPEGEPPVEKSFQVLDDDDELATPFADVTYLNQLSAQTAASGGATFLPSQIDELIARIGELRRSSASPIVKKYRLGDGPLTAWPLLIGVIGLLTAEWVCRRRWGLV